MRGPPQKHRLLPSVRSVLWPLGSCLGRGVGCRGRPSDVNWDTQCSQGEHRSIPTSCFMATGCPGAGEGETAQHLHPWLHCLPGVTRSSARPRGQGWGSPAGGTAWAPGAAWTGCRSRELPERWTWGYHDLGLGHGAAVATDSARPVSSWAVSSSVVKWRWESGGCGRSLRHSSMM